jgi:prephenate dehydrogenase
VSAPFEHVVVVGVGLIGGSLAAALRRLPDAPRVTGIDPDEASLALAIEAGVLDDAVPAASLEDAVAVLMTADVVVLAGPVASAASWLELLGQAGYAGVVTDVASTKAAVMADARRLLAPGATFVGGHPMAGSERSGVAAADPELFRGAYYVLTPASDTDAEAYRRLHRLVTSIGARVIALDASAHDEAVAAISHVPHIAASALTNLAAERAEVGSDVLRLAAGGFKDMTRIAAGSPDLWTGICLDNRSAVVRGLDELGAQLSEFAALLRAGDTAGVRAWLARAADVRRSLPARWVPASERLRELTVSMTDRPGAVSSITQAAAHAGCNIEDIGIDHVTEDTAVLHLLLTDEGDADALVAELTANNFEVTLEPLPVEGGGA